MAMNTYVPGWVPSDPALSFEPVQVGTVHGLTGCELADGRGLLVWSNGTSACAAITDSPVAWLGDDVIGPADVFTLPVAGNYVGAATVFKVEDDLYVHANVSVNVVGNKLLIYKADDPDDPAGGWTLRSTVLNGGGTIVPTDNTAQNEAGIPYVSGSRWVISAGTYEASSFGGAAFYNRWADVYVSSNGDAGPWSLQMRNGGGAGPVKVGYGSTQIARDPVSGTLHVWAQIETASQERYEFASADLGSTWAAVSGGSLFPLYFAFVDTDAAVYAGRTTGALFRREGSAPWVEVGRWWPSDLGGGAPSMLKVVPNVGVRTFSFAGSRVAAVVGGWTVGSIGMG